MEHKKDMAAIRQLQKSLEEMTKELYTAQCELEHLSYLQSGDFFSQGTVAHYYHWYNAVCVELAMDYFVRDVRDNKHEKLKEKGLCEYYKEQIKRIEATKGQIRKLIENCGSDLQRIYGMIASEYLNWITDTEQVPRPPKTKPWFQSGKAYEKLQQDYRLIMNAAANNARRYANARNTIDKNLLLSNIAWEELKATIIEEELKKHLKRAPENSLISDIFPIKAEPIKIWLDRETWRLKDNMDECIEKTLKQIDKFKNDVNEKIANIRHKANDPDGELMKLYNQCDIIDDFGFAAEKNLDKNAVADKILKQAQSRLVCEHLLVGWRPLQDLQKIPLFIPWQSVENSTPGHIWISSDDQIVNKKHALDLARNLIVRMLAAFRPGLVRLSFLDPQNSGEAVIFSEKMKDVSELYYKEVMSSYGKIVKHIELLNSKIDERQKILPVGCRSIAEYNLNHISDENAQLHDAIPYEVVVIFDFQNFDGNNLDENNIDRLLPLINHGAKYGIYLLVVSTEIPYQKHYIYDKIDKQKFICINVEYSNPFCCRIEEKDTFGERYKYTPKHITETISYKVSYFDAEKQKTAKDTNVFVCVYCENHSPEELDLCPVCYHSSHKGSDPEYDFLVYREEEEYFRLFKSEIKYSSALKTFIFLPLDDQAQPLAINGKISPALNRYFEKLPGAFKIWKEANMIDINIEQFLKEEFKQINEKGFSVPIGVSGNKPFHFELDQTGNTHTFILGKPGSGKSVLLHDILTAAVLKYSPEELNLYLMDFKKGGVEFNSYAPKNGIANADAIPRVKAALLDGCDRQVVLEILRDIENEMKKRGKLFDEKGTKKLSEYNAVVDRSERKPTIILAVDECHLLFSTNDEHQKNINRIIENIATEGRSQGIHFIFATQTLAGWEIPTKIMKTISNRFVLNADPADARHLLDDERVEVELKKLEKYGAIYRTDKDKELRMIKPGYIKQERLDELMQSVCEKAKRDNLLSREKQFIFRGAWEPSVAERRFEQSCKETPMTIGVKFTLDKEPLYIPILKKDGGDNLLIIGNQEEQDGEAARNALRIVNVSLLSLTEYYRQNNKRYEILIINHLDADENKELNEGLKALKRFATYKDCKFIEGQDAIEKTFVELWQRINSKETSQPDTFLYILGAQSFRALKYDEPLNPPVISYSKCLEKILNNGAPYGIHTVLQTDKKDNLYLKDSYNIKKFFKYMVLLGMPKQEASSLTKMDLSTDTLPTEKERLKAIFFNDATSKSTTFVPYAQPVKEYVEKKISNINH